MSTVSLLHKDFEWVQSLNKWDGVSHSTLKRYNWNFFKFLQIDIGKSKSMQHSETYFFDLIGQKEFLW